MSNTVKQLGFIPTNRGEYDTTGQTRYYKDNVVQYRNGSYICTPVGYSSSNPTAYTTDAPYQDGDTQLNVNWKLMASVGLVDSEPTAGSTNLVESGGVKELDVVKISDYSVEGIYTSITTKPKTNTIVIKINLGVDCNNLNIALSTGPVSSYITTNIYTGSLSSGTYYFEAVYGAESYLRVCKDNNTYPSDSSFSLYEDNIIRSLYDNSLDALNLPKAIDATPTQNSHNYVESGGVYNAVQDGINQANQEIQNLEDNLYGDSSHEILDTSNPVAGTVNNGQWKTNSLSGYWLNAVLFVGNYKGRTLRIVPKSTKDGTTYTFLKDNVLIHNENVNLCDGYTGTLTVYSTTEMPIPSDAEYLLVRLNNTNTLADKTPQSLLILAQEGDLDKKVDKVAGKGLSTNDYTDEDKEKVASIPTSFVSPSDLDNYVPKEQGIENAGLLLKVGTDGKVTLGTGGVAPDVTDCVRKEVTRTLYLGANVLSGVIGVGTGWTENAGNYTHTTGDTSPLVFPLTTDSGDAYVAVLSYSAIGQKEANVLISIGDGVPCDIYNGTFGPFYVGMISDGGNLKITAVSDYAGTISGVELRKVVTEEDAEISVTLDTSNNKHYENVSAGTTSGNITGWWNIAIGATDSLSSNQNGSRCIAIGQRSLSSMQGGTRNIGIGTFSLHRFIYGIGNIAIGTDAGWYMTGGNDNVFVGKSAFGEVRASNPQSNIAIGKSALSQNTLLNPENNVAIGEFALAGGSSSTAKTNCVAVGNSAGRSNNTKCVAIGVNAAFYMMGQGNVAIGYDAMNFYNVDGQNNVCIGHLAKLYPPSRPATINNAIAIGYNTRATKSNQVVIGNTDNDEFVLGGKKLVFNEDNTITWVAI